MPKNKRQEIREKVRSCLSSLLLDRGNLIERLEVLDVLEEHLDAVRKSLIQNFGNDSGNDNDDGGGKAS